MQGLKKIGEREVYIDSSRVLNTVNVCFITNSSSFSVNVPSGWAEVKYSFLDNILNTNTNVFEPYNGGIKVKKDGIYMVFFTINADGGGEETSAVLYINTDNIFVEDCGGVSGMINMRLTPYIISLKTNDIIYAYFRTKNCGDFRIRGRRSSLGVVKL